MVSHPENGSDSPIGSDRDRGRDTSCCRSFSAAKILPNPKLKKIKEKFLCRIFGRNYGT